MSRLSLVSGLALLSFLTTVRATDEVPGPPQTKPILLANAIIHPVSGPTIENGYLLFEDGVITAVSKQRPKESSTVINLKGQHVYLSLIHI